MRDQNSNEESHCAGDYTHSGVLRNEIEKVLPNWLESHSSVEDIINEIGADENGPETPQATNRHSNSIVSYNNRILTDVRDDSSRNREIVFHAATVAQQFRSLVEQKTAIGTFNKFLNNVHLIFIKKTFYISIRRHMRIFLIKSKEFFCISTRSTRYVPSFKSQQIGTTLIICISGYFKADSK